MFSSLVIKYLFYSKKVQFKIIRTKSLVLVKLLLQALNFDIVVCIYFLVTNTRPPQLLITKVKRFGGSSSFIRRSQWRVEQLQQVNGINPNKVSSITCCILTLHFICIQLFARFVCSPVSSSFRTAQSLIWFLTMLWTSGWLTPQQTSVFLSRSCTTPVKPTGRGKQVVWESQGKWERKASGDELIKVIENWQELVTQIPMNSKTYRHDGRALFFPNTQNSLTASPN